MFKNSLAIAKSSAIRCGGMDAQSVRKVTNCFLIPTKSKNTILSNIEHRDTKTQNFSSC
jgi:hypothetical protein